MIRDGEVLNALTHTVRRFVRERLLPAEARVEEEDAIPPELVAEMRALGLFGMSIPEEYGGLGLTMEEEVLVALELGYASPAFRSVIATNNGIGSQGIIVDGTARNRVQFGKPIAEHQLVQAMLADSATETFAGRPMVVETARQFDAGERVIQVASAKLFCSEMVGRVADRAMQIHCGAGYMQDCPVEHFYRDVRLFRLYEGTSHIQQLIIAREMLNA